MSILSTNQKLIKVGQDYSAGENIGIYEHTISSRNWSPDITYAAESAFQRATGYTDTQISALSGDVSSEVSQLGSDIDYISGVALTSHQSLEGYLTKASGDEYYQPIGSYATVSQLESTSGEIVNLIPTDYVSNETLEQTSGNIVNLIPDTSEFITNASAEQTYQPIGNYLSSNALEGYATQDWVQDQGYLTGVSIPESATWQDVSTTVQTNSAQWAEGGAGDEEVNELVRSSSAEWNDVSSKLDESVFQETSGLFLTAIPQEYITESDIPNFISAKLDTSSFADVSGDFLTNEDLNGYATESFVENVSGDITALIPMDYATNTQINELSGAIDYVSANAGDQEVYNIVHTNSAKWDSVTNKLDTTAFSDVSSTFLTAHQSLDGYATETLVEETSGAITSLIPTDYYPDTNPSGFISGVDLSPYATTAEVDTLSSMLSGAIDYVSANAGDEFPVSADEAIQYVQTNSAGIDDTVNNVQTNSGVWGGSALPISAGPGIKVNLVDNTLVFSNDETVIFNGNISGQITDFNTNEQINDFEKLDVYYCCNDDGLSLLGGNITTYDTNVLTAQNQISFGGTYTISNGYTCFYNLYYTITNGSAFSCTQSKRYWLAPTATTGEGNVMYNPTADTEKKKNGYIYKIVGINRKK